MPKKDNSATKMPDTTNFLLENFIKDIHLEREYLLMKRALHMLKQVQKNNFNTIASTNSVLGENPNSLYRAGTKVDSDRPLIKLNYVRAQIFLQINRSTKIRKIQFKYICIRIY